MSKSPSTSRKQRRNYENWLKKYNPVAYSEWKSSSLERGNSLHENHTNTVNDKQESHYQNIQANMVIALQEKGLSEKEIEREIAIWTMTLKPWNTSGKALTLKEATKQYDLEFNNDKDSSK